MEDARALVLAQLVAGEIARGDRGVVGFVGHAKRAELLFDLRTGPRRIRQEHDDAAGLAEGARCGGGARKGVSPVMHHAPNVDEPRAIAGAHILHRIDAVSYTHLTLPTILRV